ncbi:hypothetical protein B0H14DRAFT_2846090, partial [Mycena olivaceomarginata]
MTAQNTQRLARIGSPGNGVSIAAVFGVEWIFDLAYSAHNAAVEAWKSCLRLWFGEFKRCTICDDELWVGDLVSCSNDENRHWYCLKCFESTTTAMITGGPRQLHGLGLPLITCAHCSYVVGDEREDTEHLPAPQIPNNGSLRRRLAQTISSYIGSSPSIKKPERFHCPECDFLTCLPPQGCGTHFQPGLADDHKCRTDDLRLEIETCCGQIPYITCPSCSAALVKDGGCNHCTCLCRAEYCHICHASLGRDQSSVWKTHFCDHFIEGGQGRCTQTGCRRCPLYSDRDDEGIRRRVEGEVTRRWRRQRVWNGIK